VLCMLTEPRKTERKVHQQRFDFVEHSEQSKRVTRGTAARARQKEDANSP
jgi:hypothetical protein